MTSPVMPCSSSSCDTGSSPAGEVSSFNSSHFMPYRSVPTKNRPMVLGPVWLPMTGPM